MRNWPIDILLCFVFCVACAAETNSPATTSPPKQTTSPQPGTGPAILFARDDDLWRMDVQAERVERLTEGDLLNWGMAEGHDWRRVATYRPPQVSPDGRWIALSRTGRDLVLVDAETFKWEQIPEPGAPLVAWSPDSGQFAYVPESVDTAGGRALYLYTVQEGKTRRLLHLDAPAGVGLVSVVWSPDGRRIAFGCCFTITGDGSGTRVGQIQWLEVATGQRQTVGEIISSIGGGTPPLCWTIAGTVATKRDVTPTEAVRCSHDRLWPNAVSPDGTLVAALSRSGVDDDRWVGPSRLTVTQVNTEKVMWQRDLQMNAKQIAWWPDGRYLLFDDNEPNSPIWRINAGGTAAAEEIVPDGYLLDVTTW